MFRQVGLLVCLVYNPKVIEQIVAGKVKNCIMIIRKELLSAFLSQLGATTSVFETTINNRNQLPREIGLVFARAVTAEYEETF